MDKKHLTLAVDNTKMKRLQALDCYVWSFTTLDEMLKDRDYYVSDSVDITNPLFTLPDSISKEVELLIVRSWTPSDLKKNSWCKSKIR